MEEWCCSIFIISLVFGCGYWKEKLHCYSDLQLYFQSKCESDTKRFTVSSTDKILNSYVNVQLWSKFCLCLLNMSISGKQFVISKKCFLWVANPSCPVHFWKLYWNEKGKFLFSHFFCSAFCRSPACTKVVILRYVKGRLLYFKIFNFFLPEKLGVYLNLHCRWAACKCVKHSHLHGCFSSVWPV